MTLYNLKSADGQFRITKFDDDLNPESSYLVSDTECECPAGHRPTCRHRQMLSIMLKANALDQPTFYDHDNRTFYDMAPAGESYLELLQESTQITADPILSDEEIASLPDGVEKDNAVGDEIQSPTAHPTFGHIARRV